jgi:hypothetical protein
MIPETVDEVCEGAAPGGVGSVAALVSSSRAC